jgi:multiple sugar transport system ATP-binding protein
MNLIEGRAQGGNGIARFRGPDGIDFDLGPVDGLGDGVAITIGVRPEHLSVVAPETSGAIDAKISVIEPTGSDTVIVARRGGTEIVASTRSRITMEPGERVGLRPEAGRMHLFGSESRRIDLPHSLPV